MTPEQKIDALQALWIRRLKSVNRVIDLLSEVIADVEVNRKVMEDTTRELEQIRILLADRGIGVPVIDASTHPIVVKD